jgi:O-Antigen ligase
VTGETTVASLAPARVLTAARASAIPRDAGAVAFALVFVVPLAAANGGYEPAAWGWGALGAGWLAALGLTVGGARRPGRLDLLALGALSALVGWILLSLLWTTSVTRTMLEAERALLYVTVVGTLLLLVRPAAYRALLFGVWGGIVLVCLYALGTRLFPERLGSFDPLAGYRLAEPLGYWNALGVLAAMGAVLGVGLALRARPWPLRAAGGGSLVVLLPTLYFAFGRGPWLALGIGVAAALLVDPRRLQLVAGLLVLAPCPAIAVWIASRSEGLVRGDAPLPLATHDGHRLAAILVALAAGAALSAVAVGVVERRVAIPVTARRAFAALIVAALAFGLVGVFVRYGSPQTLARKAYDAFRVPEPAAGTNLNERLFDLSGNGRDLEWRVAWRDARDHPLLGSGAGSYEEAWLRTRTVSAHARDAHNLYLETLAELGPLGLVLLVGALGVPLAAGFAVRKTPWGPIACGAYVVFLAHAFVDWDWELPAVTLTALFCGGALLVAARRRDEVLERPARAGALAAALAASALALVVAVGNSALASSDDAIAAGNWSKAEAQAKRAKAWAPWSSDPWRRLGEAQAASGDLRGARVSLRRAVAKDGGDWSLWYGLASVARGREQAHALAEATRLNPLGSEVAQLREELGR